MIHREENSIKHVKIIAFIEITSELQRAIESTADCKNLSFLLEISLSANANRISQMLSIMTRSRNCSARRLRKGWVKEVIRTNDIRSGLQREDQLLARLEPALRICCQREIVTRNEFGTLRFLASDSFDMDQHRCKSSEQHVVSHMFLHSRITCQGHRHKP